MYASPLIDCHVHVFDPERFPYAADAWYRPDVAARQQKMPWDTPRRRVGFGA